MICPSRLPRVSALLLASVVILSSRVGRADSREDAVVARLVQMNRRALDDYDSLEWKRAKRRLLEAIVEAKKARIEKHPIVARTYLHLGAVLISGFRDREAGIQSFVHALEIDPQIRVASAMETAAITRAFADAQAKLSAGSADSDSPGVPRTTRSLTCRCRSTPLTVPTPTRRSRRSRSPFAARSPPP
jgi:hypothetical protein